MDATTFKGLFPQFSSSSYDARIDTLLLAAPAYDENVLGNQLDMATSLWVADQLAVQDIAIKFGAAAGAASSSSSTEKTVDKVTTKAALSQSQSHGLAGQTTYGARLAALLREYGAGAVAV